MLAIPILFLVVYACARFYRWILNPLAISEDSVAEFKRERTLSYVLFTTIFMTSIGVLILVITYIVGLVRHIRRQSASAGAAAPVASLRVIPRFSLSELLVMVFSIGFAPVVIQSLLIGADPTVGFWALIIAIAIFPLCFLGVLYRLDFHCVPSCKPRMLLLAITPYMVLSIASIPIAPFFFFLFSLNPNRGIPPQMYAWMVAMCFFIAGGRVLAGHAASAAQAAIAQRAAETANASALAQSDSVV